MRISLHQLGLLPRHSVYILSSNFSPMQVTVEKAAGSDMPDIDMKKLVAKSLLL